MHGQRIPRLFEPHLRKDPIPVWLVMLIFFSIIGPPFVSWIVFSRYINSKKIRHGSVTVLVLGDIGRSPRMMYHTESFAKNGWETFMVGYGETEPIPSLLTTPHIHLLHLLNPPRIITRFPWIIRAPIRIIYQIISVIHLCIFKIPFHTEVLIVQNPPSIPTLALAQFISRCTDAKLIIDWHNTGYSILAMRTGAQSRLVKWASWFEKEFGQKAWAHLFVTQALRDYLVKQWNLKGRFAVLHDRPPPHFKRTEPMIQHELFERLSPDLHLDPSPSPSQSSNPTSTLFTEISKPTNLPILKPSRPALLISSTSWTADEDFTPLLTALDKYQTSLTQTRTTTLPKLIIIITGIGPLRSVFEDNLQKKKNQWKDIEVRCIFVSASDYPVLLGSADLGISLHSSSSGRDLPMKVVDMFGCGVPVLAKGFECLGELVKDGINGRVFNDGRELGELMIDLLTGFPNSKKLDTLKSYFVPQIPDSPGGHSTSRKKNPKANVATIGTEDAEWNSWEENWNKVMQKNVLVWRKKTE